MVKLKGKKIVALCLAVAFVSPAIVSHAAQVKQPKDPQVAQYTAQIKDITNSNKELKESIKQKHTQIKNFVKELKGNKTFKVKKDAYNNQMAVLKKDIQDLKALKGTAKENKQALKQDRANKNHDAVIKDLQNILSAKQNRHNAFEKINKDLDNVLNALQN